MRTVAALTVMAVLGVSAYLWLDRSQAPATALITLRDTPTLSVAVVGDVLGGERLAAFSPAPDILAPLQQSSMTLADLDQALGASSQAIPTLPRQWPTGPSAIATALRSWGTSVVTTANEHVSGQEQGPSETRAVLTRAGLLSTGSGNDLDDARAPAIIGTAPRRIAVLNVATSVPPSGRASKRRGDVAGRPGVNTLRYAAVVTADPATFTALSQMAKVMSPDGESATADTVSLSGTTIRKGNATSVDLVVAPDDLIMVLDDVKAARANADVVIVSLHTHEPDNRSESPALFVQAFARQAIEAGAALVVGHGSRQLRGVEVHQGGVILYGLGSFAFERTAIPEGAGTAFDSGVSAYDLALGAVQRPELLHLPRFDEAEWWESVVATATFAGTQLSSVTLLPLDLGVDLKPAAQGLPRLAGAERATTILRRLQDMSAAFRTEIRVEGGRGVIAVPAEHP